MKRLNRRRFVALATVGVAGTALTACGGDKTTSTNLQPTRISDVAGAPTLASQATPPNVSAGGGAGAGAGGGEAQTTVNLTAVDLKFEPADFTIAADTDVTINLKNNGALTHNVYIEKTDFTSKPLPGGESETFKINLPPGTWDYWCPEPGHKEAGMVGKITAVAPGAAAAESPAEVAPAAGGEAQTTVDLEAVDIAFKPADFTIAADTDVTVNLKNTGALTHNFHLPKTNFTSKPLTGGESESFKLNLPPGTYEYWCPQPGHKEAGMVGKITAVAAGAAPSGGGGAASPEAGASPAASPEASASPAASPEASASPAGQAPAAAASSAPTTAEIHTEDIKFDKTELTIAANTDVKITVNNKGVLQHDFHVDKLNITSKLLNSGETDTVTINAKPGEYDYWCTVPGHKEAGMVGKLFVK
ncbi:MAG: cupredoxin domain-containing protein [Thermomicrobiales bacterium]